MTDHRVRAEAATFHFDVPPGQVTVTRGEPPKPPWDKRIKDVVGWAILVKKASDEFGLTDFIQSFFNRIASRTRRNLARMAESS